MLTRGCHVFMVKSGFKAAWDRWVAVLGKKMGKGWRPLGLNWCKIVISMQISGIMGCKFRASPVGVTYFGLKMGLIVSWDPWVPVSGEKSGSGWHLQGQNRGQSVKSVKILWLMGPLFGSYPVGIMYLGSRTEWKVAWDPWVPVLGK